MTYFCWLEGELWKCIHLQRREGFPFWKMSTDKTFWQLLWNSSQSFPYPDKDKNCSLLFHKLVLLFCVEYRCMSLPHFLLPAPCFTQTVVSSRFFQIFYTRGNLLIKILEFIKLIHCFCLKKNKIKWSGRSINNLLHSIGI